MHQGEKFNVITHLVGLGMSIVGAVALIVGALAKGGAFMLASFTVFGLSMIALYASSTVYHGAKGESKDMWEKADHCAIYLLIAGTYTPFSLLASGGVWGVVLLAVVWCLALAGVVKELRSARHSAPSLKLYIALGWVVIAAMAPVVQHLPESGWWWLLAGGAFYTVGIPFYVKGHQWPHAHGVWHLFVLGGTTTHFFTVFNYIA